MPSKLYVSNLSQAATLSGIRQLFGTCGEVVNVEFVAERNNRSGPSAAHIVMATEAGADKALSILHGRLYGERTMMLSREPNTAAEQRDDNQRARNRERSKPASVAILQQYRDRHALAYELDCMGLRVTFRFVFPEEPAQTWQLEARIGANAHPAAVAVAKTRTLALHAVKEAWPGASPQSTVPELDWDAVETALRNVKAL